MSGGDYHCVQIAVTATVLRAIGQIPPLAGVWQTARGRGHDLLWVASYALSKARTLSREMASFTALLPTADDAVKVLCVEYALREDGRPIMVIGFPEEFAIV